jgi:hypothetical protein
MNSIQAVAADRTDIRNPRGEDVEADPGAWYDEKTGVLGIHPAAFFILGNGHGPSSGIPTWCRVLRRC